MIKYLDVLDFLYAIRINANKKYMVHILGLYNSYNKQKNIIRVRSKGTGSIYPFNLDGYRLYRRKRFDEFIDNR